MVNCTTHYACDCILSKQQLVEDVVNAAKQLVARKRDSDGAVVPIWLHTDPTQWIVEYQNLRKSLVALGALDQVVPEELERSVTRT